MRFIFDGNAADAIPYKLYKAADEPAIPVRVLNADGSPLDVTASTVTLEVYNRLDRSTAVVTSLALATVTAAAGALTLTPSIATTAFGPGTYYVFLKHVLTAGAVVTVSVNHVKLVVG